MIKRHRLLEWIRKQSLSFGYIQKHTIKDRHYLVAEKQNISALFNPYHKSFFVLYRDLTQRHTTGHWQRVTDFLALSPKWNVLINPLLFLKAQRFMGKEEAERLYEPEMMDDSKEIVPSRYNRSNAHMNSQILWQHAQDCIGQRKI